MKTYFRDNLLNLLEPDGRFWGLSTPWHPDDLNADLKRSPAFTVLRRAVGGNLEPVWWEKWPQPRLAERREEIGSTSFTRAYQLQALGETDATIRPEWVRYWEDELPRGAFDQVILSVDPAVSAKQSADASALVMLGTIEREVRCLQATAYRVAAPMLVELIHQWDLVWRPEVILFESNAAFAGLRDLMVSHAAFGPKVRGVVQSRSKMARLAGLAVVVQNGHFRLRGNGHGVHPSQRQLFEELTGFPYRKHDDLADAAATGTAYLFAQPQPRLWV